MNKIKVSKTTIILFSIFIVLIAIAIIDKYFFYNSKTVIKNQVSENLKRPLEEEIYKKFHNNCNKTRCYEKYIKPYLAIPCKYDFAYPFQEGLAAVKINNKWGYIDQKGNWVIKPKYNKAFSFQEGLAPAAINDKWGYINKKGNWIIKPRYNFTGYFSDGLAFVRIKCKKSNLQTDKSINKKDKNIIHYNYGFINMEGKFIIPPSFDKTSNFHEGLAFVEVSKKWRVIDKNGKYLIKSTFENYKEFKNGLAAVEINNKWGFIDKQGSFKIKPQYSKVSGFNEGLAVACVKVNSCGYINNLDQFIIEPVYELAHPFKEGLAGVKQDKNRGYINKKGNWVIKSNNEYDIISEFSEGLALVVSDFGDFSLYGYINKEGNWVIEPILQNAGSFHNGYADIEINGKYGYIKNPLNKGK